MLMTLLIIAAAVFFGYAIFTYYQTTDATKSVPMRLLSSVGLAAAAIGAAISSWFHSGATP